MSSNILGRQVIKTALKYDGCSTGSIKHLDILKTFNSVKPHGYTAQKTDYWCDIFVSAMWIKAGLTSKDVPLSCNVDQSIADAKKIGIFYGAKHKPRTGDAIILDWDANGKPNHIGLVAKVTDHYIYTIEGNAGDKGICKRKTYAIGAPIIYGFICPKYNAILINKRAINYSYPLGTDKKKYSVKTGKPRNNFKTAWHKYLPKRKMGSGCHQFVMLVLKSCGYKTMPLAWNDIQKYLKERFTVMDFHHKESDLRKGDVMVYKRVDNKGAHFHIWVIIEVNGKLCMAEARQNKCWAYKRTVNKALKNYNRTWLYRAKER